MTALPRFAALSSLPAGYILAGRLAIESRRTFILLNLASLLPLAGGALLFYGVDRALQTLGVSPAVTVPLDNPLLVALAILVLTPIELSVHELCHGLAFQAFGAHPKYGINLNKGVAYASATESYFTRDAYLIVALAPLLVISVLSVAGMALTEGGLRLVAALMGTINAGSAVGDLWFTLVCLRSPRDLLVRDFGDGAELYRRHPDETAR